MTSTETEHGISKDEVALYDRQIRLWGLEAQNRILVINIGALANEVVKNIVLAGIGSLTILDSHTVAIKDLGAQFFVEQADAEANLNRGEAVKFRIQRLNPHVAISIDTRAMSEIPETYFADFDVVVAMELEYDELIKVNNATRRAGKYFYAAGLFGLYGYVFADLVKHKFKISREQTTSHTKIGPETSTRSILDIHVTKDGQTNQETLTKLEEYRSLHDVVSNVYDSHTADFGAQFRARKQLKINPLLPCLLAYWKNPGIESSSLFKEAVLEHTRLLGLPAGIISDEIVDRFYKSINTELSPVAAVVGGVLGQDILNVLSQKEQPIQNLFLFDGDKSEGPIYCV